jgi:hypothetical protein
MTGTPLLQRLNLHEGRILNSFYHSGLSFVAFILLYLDSRSLIVSFGVSIGMVLPGHYTGVSIQIPIALFWVNE